MLGTVLIKKNNYFEFMYLTIKCFNWLKQITNLNTLQCGSYMNL